MGESGSNEQFPVETQKFEDTINEQEKHIKRLEHENGLLLFQRDELQEFLKHNERNYSKFHEEFQELKVQNREQGTEIEQLKKHLARMEEIRADLRRSHHDASYELSEEQQKHQDALTRIEQLQDVINAKSALISELTSELAKKRAYLVSLPGMSSDAVGQSRLATIENLSLKIQQLEASLIEATERSRNYDEEISSLRDMARKL